MNTRVLFHEAGLRPIFTLLLLCAAVLAQAAPPVVSTVPVDPNDPIQPHDIISGKTTTLKGAVDAASVGATWTWNPGDGSASVSGVVNAAATSISQMDDIGFTPHYAIWIPHSYTGTDGDVFLATLTVTNGAGESSSAVYRMRIRTKTVPTEVNTAIDEALWFMHRNLFRFNGLEAQTHGSMSGGSIPMGKWDFVQTGGTTEASSTAAALNAFEANGYLEGGPASSPYTETVQRALRYVIASLTWQGITLQTAARPAGSPDDPDTNGNGIGLFVNGGAPTYQGGMVMDAIIASGTPDAVAVTGPANVIGRTYGDIIQDMVDWYAWAQSDNVSHGGWQYGPFSNSGGVHDNSASGWGAIGLVAAEDIFGSTVPQWVKDRNETGLEFTDTQSDTSDADGQHGYTSIHPVWGPYGTTSAAMVQMTMDDIESTTSLTPDERWIRAENFFRRHFNDAASGNNFKNYYYGMFNFAKAMRTALPDEVVVIGADNSVGCGPGGGTPGCSAQTAPLDWYLDPAVGLARVIIDYQATSGVNIGLFSDRPGNSQGGHQDEHNTPWATQILTRTLFQAGPVARAAATPNPGAANSPISFDASGSFHQDPARSLILYEWDFDNDGIFDTTGVNSTSSFDCPTLPVPCSYTVRLRVTDNNVPARFSDDLVVVEITIPPRPPTANAGGPYLVCANEEFSLDGSGSSDVDEGTSESGEPPFDTITRYDWELDGISPFDFDEASGVSPLISFPLPGSRDIGLQVADNTSVAFPTAAQPDLTDRDFTSVTVGNCGCIGPITARTKPGKAQLVWDPVPGAATYDVLRSVKGSAERFEAVVADHVTGYATWLDRGLTNGTTYWYRVVPKGIDGMPICAFSQAVAATPQTSRRARTEFVAVPDVVGLAQSVATAELMNAGLAAGNVDFAHDAVIAEGAVISTDPSVGSSVAEGSAVDLLVSLGPPRVATPDVTGQLQADAEAAIVAAGLVVGDISSANSDTVPSGSVISQDPPGGVEVIEGSAVALHISLGPVTVAVPDVVGETQADGEAALVAAGLAVGDVATQNSATIPAGVIISQDPSAGADVVLGTAVDLLVSLGPVTVAVPDVIGLAQADAETALVAADLIVGTVTTQNSSTVAAGHVINQTPGAGSNVEPGTAVDLVVSLGAVQVTVPNVVGLTQAEAEAALVGADLGAGAITEETSPSVPAGHVISQDPAAGATADESSLVALVISLGPRQVTVPDVTGQPQATAESAIVAADLTVGTVSTSTSPTVPAGSVISQNPAGGSTVDEQSAVDLTVSSGPAQVTVPNVTGLSEADAATALAAADLQVGVVTSAHSINVPAGDVISQNPVAGTTVDEQSAVDLVVSLGPQQVEVPAVVGISQSDAATAINGAGLIVGTVDSVNSDTVPAGEVISQDPAGGVIVDEGSAVNLVVSLGAADIEVPNVVGLTQAAAESAITGAGLTVGTVTSEPSFTVPEGQVISQNPAAGLFVADGSAVNLVISEGAPPDDEDPVLSASLDKDPPVYDQGETVQVSITATDNSGFVTVTFSLDGGAPQAATLPVTGIDTSGFAPGSAHTLLLTATDAQSNSVSQTLNFTIFDPNDVTPPVAALSSPADLSEVSFMTDIIGTASDAGLVRYQMGVRRASGTNFTIFAEGTSSVTNGILGQLDPTLLEDGIYVVRLVAEDAGGLVSIAEHAYSLKSTAKPGIARISFVDLAVPVSGVPIVVERVYDNRNKGFDDYGYGWRLQIRQGSFESNRKPGDGWQILSGGGFLNLPCQNTSETKNHLTEVRVSDREWFQFKLAVTSNGAIGGGCDVTARFDFVDGSTPGATLQILDGTSAFYPNGTDHIVNDDPNDDDFMQTYNPKSVRLVTIDGRRYDFDANFGGITRLQDLNGNFLTIGNGGVTHSSGKGISFARDGAGRITQITDPRGNTLEYVYDVAGDLVSFFDQAGNETTFEYDAKHNLLAIDDPLGNRASTNEYDADGRLIAVIDANGNRIEFTRDLEGREEVVTNARGAVTRFLYDEKGNVTVREQTVTIEGVPTVATTTFAYDGNDNETLIIDPDGKTTEQTFSPLNMPLTRVVDPGGLNITESFSYNARADLLTDTDPNGLVQTFAYNSGGNPTTWEDRDGFLMNFTYDSKGQLTGKTDGAGNSRSVSYSAEGEVIEEIDPLGVRTTYSYDDNGNKLTETLFRNIGGSLTGLTTSYQYDALNNVTRIEDPAGNVTLFEYNAIGKRSAMVDPLGRRTEYEYDAVGARVLTRFPDGTTELQAYDSSGNVISSTDRAGRTTLFEYDELNRLTRTVGPDGTDSRTIYTPGGRVAATIDEMGRRKEFIYNAAGRLVELRLPAVEDVTTGVISNPTVRFEYDAGGRQTAVIDAAGSRTEFDYDVPNNTVTLLHPDGTEEIFEYDHLSRLTAVTDEEGMVTRYTYEGESRDRLASVVLPSPDGIALGAETLYSYDESGNLLSQTDALGRVTTFGYDLLNRLTEVTIPSGSKRSTTFDAVGNALSQSDFDGLATTFEYDSMNRLIRKNLPDGSSVDYLYTPTGLRQSVTDNRGTTVYSYDVMDRLASVLQPATGEINYEYDNAGNVTRMVAPNSEIRYGYDALNRLASLEVNGESIEYGYDAAGRLAVIAEPNGIVAEQQYDSRGRLIGVAYNDEFGNPIESYSYDYSPAGRLERVEESDGSVVTFAYDGAGRLTGEQRSGSSPFTRSHAYDTIGNRTSAVVDGVTTNFTYDVNDRLISANTTSFSYDTKGNLVERSGPGGTIGYSWTPENRLAGVNDGSNVTTFGYDPDGTRVSKQSGTETTRFLVDDRNPTGYAQVLEETDASGSLLAAYQFGKGPATAEVGGNRIYYHRDALRNTRLLTDSSGAVTDSYVYSAYGDLVGSSGATNQPYLYNGEAFDPEAGSYYLRQRYYEPSLGRFLSRDSFMGDRKSPASLNPYLYGNADPVSFYDPSGNFSMLGISFSISIGSSLRTMEYGHKATLACRITGRIKLFRWIWLLRSIGSVFGTSFDLTGALAGSPSGTASVKYEYEVPEPPPLRKGDLKSIEFALKKSLGGSKAEIEVGGSFVDEGAVKGKAEWERGKGWTVGGELEREWEIGKFKYCNYITLGDLKLSILAEGGTSLSNPNFGAAVKGEWKLKAFGVIEGKFQAFPPLSTP